MVQASEFVLQVYDNTSAISVKIIGVKKGRQILRNTGDLVVVVPKKFYTTKEIQKRKKYIGLIIGLKKNIKRKNGIVISNLDNKILLFTFNLKFLGSRVYGGINKEIRGEKNEATFKKIITYSKGTY